MLFFAQEARLTDAAIHSQLNSKATLLKQKADERTRIVANIIEEKWRFIEKFGPHHRKDSRSLIAHASCEELVWLGDVPAWRLHSCVQPHPSDKWTDGAFHIGCDGHLYYGDQRSHDMIDESLSHYHTVVLLQLRRLIKGYADGRGNLTWSDMLNEDFFS